jgi:hypothetical protein
MKGATMKSRTDLSLSELYALERDARAARAKELARFIGAGVESLIRLAGRLATALFSRKDVSHA